jgi:hypothetical protein
VAKTDKRPGFIQGWKPRPEDERDWDHAKLVQFATANGQAARTATAAVSYPSRIVLDQQDTGHCVGFSAAGWMYNAPVEFPLTPEPDTMGHQLYYACKVADGQPGLENGTDLGTLAKVLKLRKRIAAYAFTDQAAEVVDWVVRNGPVIVGTDWYRQMFYPSRVLGWLTVSGPPEGGHAYTVVGVNSGRTRLKIRNSWGTSWGRGGHAWLKVSDMQRLLNQNGEALLALELPY